MYNKNIHPYIDLLYKCNARLFTYATINIFQGLFVFRGEHVPFYSEQFKATLQLSQPLTRCIVS